MRRNFQRHWFRNGFRVLGLMAADTAAFAVVRGITRAVRDAGAIGETASTALLDLMPPGSLAGFQFVFALLLGQLLAGSYGPGDPRRDNRRILLGVAFACVATFYQSYTTVGIPMAAARFLATWAVFGVVLTLSRRAIDRALLALLPVLAPIRAVVVAAPGEADWLRLSEVPVGARVPGSRFVVADRVVHSPDAPAGEGFAGLLERAVNRHRVDTVLVSGTIPEADFARVADAAAAHGCHLLAGSRVSRFVGMELRARWIAGMPLIELSTSGLRGSQMAAKRGMDLVGSLVGLVLFAPLMLLLWAAIRLESPGPALFGQTRLGLHGKRFRCWKFRTMRVDAEEVLRSDPDLYRLYVENHFKIPPELDPRLTRLGSFLRKTSLDELPQLFNVLLGHMSLVGPRPIVPAELDHYGGQGGLLLSLRPGITGTWAVSGRSEVGYPARASLELEYIRGWSVWSDLGILLRTLPAVLRGSGAG